MRLGMFEFKRGKDDTTEAPDGDVRVEVDSNKSASIDEAWESLADVFDALSLDDLDAALESTPSTDESLKEWSELEESDDLVSFIDAFVEGMASDAPPVTSDAPPVTSDAPPVTSDAPPAAGDIRSIGDGSGRIHSVGGLESTPAPRPAETTSITSDEVVLALMQAGVVRVAQVYDASRHRTAGQPLWRAMLGLPELDRGKILDEVARFHGYERHPNSDELPIENLIVNMRETLPVDELNRLLSLGLFPAEIGIDEKTLQYRLVLVTDDPGMPGAKEAAAALPLETTISFVPSDIVAPYRETYCEPAVQQPLPSASPAEDPSSNHPLPPRASDRGPASRDTVANRVNRSWPDKNKDASAASANASAPESAAAGTLEDNLEDAAATPAEGSTAESSEAAKNVPAPATGVPGDPASLDRRASKDRVVSALFKEGRASEAQITEALKKHAGNASREALWRLLSEIEGVDREAVFSTAARIYAFPEVELGPGHPDHEFVMLIMETIAEERRDELLRLNLLPFEYAIDAETGGARLIFITHDPAKSDVHRTLSKLKLGRFELRYASEKGILGVIGEVFPQRNEYLDRMSGDENAFDLGTEYDSTKNELVDEDALEAEISRSTLINLFEASLLEGVRQGASDIHVYPNPKRKVEIHFRVDGKLRRWHVEESVHAESFLAVVKDNAMNVDRFEREAAQDGYIQRRIDDALIRFRVSVLPIASANQEIRAESIVIRILDDRKVLTDLRKLGMLDTAMERLEHAIRQPHGMVILTGPTGSGKSTTLVAALYQVISPDVNVLTIEDPVEYIINGVRQIKLSNKLDLEGAIRAVLRHDPDIVMVGEMRDKATADLAIKLANTGHLTFSTLHTNDAPSAISRLYKMGVEPFLLAYAINLIVAQRLVRGLCSTCKVVEENRDVVLMKRLGFSQDEIDNHVIYTSVRSNCATCGGLGFKGRRAISETLYFTQAIRHMIAESGEEIDEEAVRTTAIAEGMLTLQDSARELVKMGAISVEEMMRVTSTE